MSKGIENCEDAFERLVKGEPHIAAHIGLPKNKITAGVVSVEAGFDRGYLKKARPIHRSLIARIDAERNRNLSIGPSKAQEARRYKILIERIRQSEKSALERSDKLMAHNLILIERILELEKQVSKYPNVQKIKLGK